MVWTKVQTFNEWLLRAIRFVVKLAVSGFVFQVEEFNDVAMFILQED